MTTRAILWCGYVKPAEQRRRCVAGQFTDFDFGASVHDLEMAIAAAHALGVSPRNIHALVCRDDLLPPDFRGNTQPPTREALMRVTTSIARTSNPDDVLLFLASNHGESEGLFVAPPIDEFADDTSEPAYLRPTDLATCLEPLSGPQVLVIATCYAGIFLPLGARPNRVVMTACAADEKYYVEGDETPHSPFLHALLGAWSGVALPSHPTVARRGLSDAFNHAVDTLADSCRRRPCLNGAVTLP